MKQGSKYLGFPVPLLGPINRRLVVLRETDDFFALQKSAGLLGDSHPWYPDTPLIAAAIRRQLAAPTPLWEQMHIKGQARLVYPLDAEIEGVVVFAKDKEASGALRNAFGDGAFTFTFHLVSGAPWPSSECHCTLPIAPHFEKPRMVVSNKTGKKTETSFKLLKIWGPYALWEAKTNYLRSHQIRIHAYESGLNILGENLYQDIPQLYLSSLKKRYKGKKLEKPLYPFIAIHMVGIELGSFGKVEVPFAKAWGHMLQALEEYI